MIKELVIFVCLLLIGIACIIAVRSVLMPHSLGAAIAIFSSVFVIAGGAGLWAILDGTSQDDDDDDDGPHFYGPGGSVI